MVDWIEIEQVDLYVFKPLKSPVDEDFTTVHGYNLVRKKPKLLSDITSGKSGKAVETTFGITFEE